MLQVFIVIKRQIGPEKSTFLPTYRLIAGSGVEMIGKGSVQPSMTTLLPDVRGLPAILHMIFAPNVSSFLRYLLKILNLI